MEYSIGNKTHQKEYNIQEKLSPSQLILRYIPLYPEKKNSQKKEKK